MFLNRHIEPEVNSLLYYIPVYIGFNLLRYLLHLTEWTRSPNVPVSGGDFD